MTFKKIFGWIIVLAGIALIGWAVFTSYGIFTAKREVPEIFQVGDKMQPPDQQTQGPISLPKDQYGDMMQDEMGDMLQQQLQQMLPADAIPRMLNMVAWGIFTGICIFAGSHIAGLGIRLIKA